MPDMPGGYDAALPFVPTPIEPTPIEPTVPGVEVSGLASGPGEPPIWAGEDLLTGASVRVRVLSAPADTVELDAARSHAERMTLVRPETVRDHLRRRHVVDLADGTSALVSDTVAGTSLADLLARRGTLTAGETVTVLVPILQIAGDLHASGAVLGSVDPRQVLVTDDGRPMLDVMGSLHDTADPRQAAADDVRAVGQLAWHLLGGSADAGDGRPRRREDVLGQAGAALGPAVADALHPDPMRRPRADQLLDQLFAAQDPEPIGLDGPPARPGEASLTRAERRRRIATVARRDRATGRTTKHPGRAAWTRRALALARPVVRGRWLRPGGLLLAGALVVSGVAFTASRMWPDPRSSQEAAASHTSSAERPAAIAADPMPTWRAAMRSSPAAVVQDIATARALALSERSPSLLGRAEVSGSASYRADAQIIATLTANRQRYVGLGFIVRTARLVTLRPDRAVVSAVVDRTAYDVVSAQVGTPREAPGAATTRHGASSGRSLTYELTLGATGWRLVSVGTQAARVSP